MRYLRIALRGVVGIALTAIAAWTLLSFLPLPDGPWHGLISTKGSAFELALQALLAFVVVCWCAAGIGTVWLQVGSRPRRGLFRFAQCASFLLLALLFVIALSKQIIISIILFNMLDMSIWQKVVAIVFSGGLALLWLTIAVLYSVWLLRAARCFVSVLRGYSEYSAVVTIDGSKFLGRATLLLSIGVISFPVFWDLFAFVP